LIIRIWNVIQILVLYNVHHKMMLFIDNEYDNRLIWYVIIINF
jgi:hypothetical protein